MFENSKRKAQDNEQAMEEDIAQWTYCAIMQNTDDYGKQIQLERRAFIYLTTDRERTINIVKVTIVKVTIVKGLVKVTVS